MPLLKAYVVSHCFYPTNNWGCWQSWLAKLDVNLKIPLRSDRVKIFKKVLQHFFFFSLVGGLISQTFRKGLIQKIFVVRRVGKGGFGPLLSGPL